MAALHLVGEDVEADALNAARGACETPLDDIVGQAHRFEDLGALVRLQGRDAHLGHHLQHALADALLVGVDHVGVVRHVGPHRPGSRCGAHPTTPRKQRRD